MDPIWTLNDEARTAADTVYLDHLRPIELSAFTEGLLVDRGQSPLLPGRQEREIYSDTVYDLHRLLEEVRFEVGLATMLLADFQIRRDRAANLTCTTSQRSIQPRRSSCSPPSRPTPRHHRRHPYSPTTCTARWWAVAT
jgi:hypothetical protein